MMGASSAGRGREDLPCFLSGTVIATPRGEKPVEALRPGDRVITRDNGLQELRWTLRRDVSGRAFLDRPEARPVMIRAGALGRAQPERDICLAPHHGGLVSGDLAREHFGRRLALVAARRLLELAEVHQVDALATATHALRFDTHELVSANGLWCESAAPEAPRYEGWPGEDLPVSLPRFD